MKITRSITEYKRWRNSLNCTALGFVPTMGALHIGHASLLERSVAECELTVLSIYVNATQFDNAGDLANYPDSWEQDLALAEKLGVDMVILPEYDQMYPDNYRYQVDEKVFSQKLCGAHRSGHFTGVLTVVMKLLNIVQAHKAYFGKKDYQQYRLIADMVEAFFLGTEIVGCEIVREPDGLACSSRNVNLSDHFRKLAPKFRQLLMRDLLDDEVAGALSLAGFEVDYIETLEKRRYGAVTLGEVRLIDNVSLFEEGL